MKNNKKKARRAAYLAKQEEEGKRVVKMVFAAFIILALCFLAYSIYVVM